jgi:alpha-L-fucosidase 2
MKACYFFPAMKTSLSIFLLLLFLFPLRSVAQSTPCEPVRVQNPDGNYLIPGALGAIPYRRIDGREVFMDAYVHKRGDRRPAVLVIHGGGFTAGSRIAFVGQFLETLTEAGFNWFSIDYRLQGPAKYEQSLDDLRTAVAFVRCNARRFHIDPDRIILLGEDTGAQMAALLTAEKPAGVFASVLIGGVYDVKMDSSSLNVPAPIERVSAAIPATLVIHGTADRESLPESAKKYCNALRTAGGSCEYQPVQDAIHRPENWPPHQWSYKALLVAWLRKVTKSAEAPQAAYQTRLQKKIVYDREHNLALDAWTPLGRGPFPTVIIAHGGGWEAGDRVTYATPVFEPLARAGFAWFSIDYRLTPQSRHPDQLQDLRTAIRFVRENAARFRIDPKRIAILGESASGQMVAQLATEMPPVAAVVSLYGVYDFNMMVTEWSPRSIPARLFGAQSLDDAARETMAKYSPIQHVKKDMPPLLLICGTKDRLYAQHQAFLEELRASGARFAEYPVDGAPHGIENWEGHPEWMGYKAKLIDWLRMILKPISN